MSAHTDSVYWQTMHRSARDQQAGGQRLNSLKAMICSVDFSQLVDNVRAGRWIGAEHQIAEAAKALAASGAHFILITSNTGHTLSREAAALQIQILDIAKVTSQATSASRCRTPGLLATSRCLESGIYQRWTQEYDLKVVYPSVHIANSVNELIFDELVSGIVSDAGIRVIISAVEWFAEHGADSVIFGCTDLTLLSEIVRESSPIPIFDSTRLHAEAAARAAIEGRLP